MSVSMGALLSELRQQIFAISGRELEQAEIDFLTDLIGTFAESCVLLNILQSHMTMELVAFHQTRTTHCWRL